MEGSAVAVIAHVSDLHLGHGDDGGARALRRARAMVEQLASVADGLDAVLVSGDIADHGLAEEYAQARELLDLLPCPTLVCPGNHDERAAFRSGLLGLPLSTEPVNQALALPGCTLAACDSSIPGRHDGRLDADTLGWLDGVLTGAAPDTPVLVAFHHPPVRLHQPFIDGIRLTDTGALAALADRHPHLAGFLVGHAHTAAAADFAGRPVRAAPGVVSTLRLPWEPPAGPDAQMHLDRPPGLAFHVLGTDGALVTHFRSGGGQGMPV